MVSALEYSLDALGRPRFYGIYNAIVVDNKDPLNKGRLKLKVLQPTGTEVSAWAEPCIGALAQHKTPYAIFSSNVDQPLSPNTATLISYDTTEDSNKISFSGNRITVEEEGDYLFSFSAVFAKSNSAAETVDVWVRKNGTNVLRSNTRIVVQGNPNEVVMTVPFIVDLGPKDYLQLVMSTASTNSMTLTHHHAATNPTRPETPSIIATISLVGKYKPKPGTEVWAMFVAGDPEYPVWIGTK
jgi:hypothetical protein